MGARWESIRSRVGDLSVGTFFVFMIVDFVSCWGTCYRWKKMRLAAIVFLFMVSSAGAHEVCPLTLSYEVRAELEGEFDVRNQGKMTAPLQAVSIEERPRVRPLSGEGPLRPDTEEKIGDPALGMTRDRWNLPPQDDGAGYYVFCKYVGTLIGLSVALPVNTKSCSAVYAFPKGGKAPLELRVRSASCE
jgi:hypothetical protein